MDFLPCSIADIKYTCHADWVEGAILYSTNGQLTLPCLPSNDPSCVEADGYWSRDKYTKIPSFYNHSAPWMVYMPVDMSQLDLQSALMELVPSTDQPGSYIYKFTHDAAQEWLSHYEHLKWCGD